MSGETVFDPLDLAHQRDAVARLGMIRRPTRLLVRMPREARTLEESG